MWSLSGLTKLFKPFHQFASELKSLWVHESQYDVAPLRMLGHAPPTDGPSLLTDLVVSVPCAPACCTITARLAQAQPTLSYFWPAVPICHSIPAIPPLLPRLISIAYWSIARWICNVFSAVVNKKWWQPHYFVTSISIYIHLLGD